MRSLVASFTAAVVLAASATSAWAQQATDYTVTPYAVGSRYESPPTGAAALPFSNNDDGTASVALPFTFTFFGSDYTSCNVCTNGYLQFGGSNTEYTNYALPYSTFGAAILPYWDDLDLRYQGSLTTWTSGSAPNRHFVASWEGVDHFSGAGFSFTFQVQLYESTNAIVLSYSTPSGGSWPSGGFSLGIQAADGRYQYPDASIQNTGGNNGQPGYDYLFDRPRITLTGSVLYDRYVVNGSGIGSTSQQNLVLAGMRVEARNTAGGTVGSATTDSAGSFSMLVAGVSPTAVGSIVVCSENSVCAVRPSAGGALYAATAATDVPFSQDRDVGTLTIGESNDPGGAGRAPINVARTIQSAYDWATARTADTIPYLEVLYDVSSSQPTSYTPAVAGTSPASMRVSGAGSNPDPWDVSVIRRTYARHVLGSVAADSTTSYSSNYDAGTDAQNAFAEGFGYYVDAIMSGGGRYVYDGLSSTSATIIDLEDTSGLHSTKSGSSAAWVAAALYDLVDGSGTETWDTVNGAGANGEQVFRLVDSMTAPATASSLYSAWLASGADGAAITSNFIHHGLLADDPDEPNDDAAHAKALTQFGIVLPDRVLNLFNDDWYTFSLPDPTAELTVTVSYDRAKHASVFLSLEVTNSSGAVVATGATVGVDGPMRAVSGQLPAGEYRIHTALTSGGPLPAYTIQAFAQIAFKSDRFQPWTVGRPYAVGVNITGGIPPYGLSVSVPYALPEGLAFDLKNAQVAGVPTGPSGGLKPGSSFTYDFVLRALDAASPTNEVSKLMSFTLNDSVRPRFGEFAAFAIGKPVDRPVPFSGGTSPYLSSIDEGALPHGLSTKDGTTLRFVGQPDAAGGFPFKMTATDLAGSSSQTSANCVVCVPVGSADLSGGASACGFYFDALQGSSVGLTITIAKKRPVRALRLVVIDSDGNTVLAPASVKPGKGKITVAGFVPQTTGRFYCVVASDDGGPATSLVAVEKLVAPKGGAGNNGSQAFGEGRTLEVPVAALAGATVTFTTKPDKSGIQLTAVHLLDPSGAVVDFGPKDVKVKKGAVSFTKILGKSGVWTVVLGAAVGPQGNFTYTYKLKQPSKVAYAAD